MGNKNAILAANTTPSPPTGRLATIRDGRATDRSEEYFSERTVARAVRQRDARVANEADP
jgi:hypothetical protein